MNSESTIDGRMDAAWCDRAKKAAEGGFVGAEESKRVLGKMPPKTWPEYCALCCNWDTAQGECRVFTIIGDARRSTPDTWPALLNAEGVCRAKDRELDYCPRCGRIIVPAEDIFHVTRAGRICVNCLTQRERSLLIAKGVL